MILKNKFKLQKNKNLNKNYACGIAVLNKNGISFELLKYNDAICTIKDGVATDILSKNKESYNVYEGLSAIRKAYEEGLILNNEKFCYSVYDADEIFPELNSISTDEEKRMFLKDYNRQNRTLIYWSFLDEDEIQELNDIVNENKTKYPYSI